MFTWVRETIATGVVGEAIRYGIATGLSAGLSLLLPLFFHELLKLPEEMAVALALLIVFAVNYFVIRRFVFQSSGPAKSEVFKFLLATGAFRICEYLAFLVALNFTDLNYMKILILVLIASFMLKFIVHRTFVFSNR